MNKTKFEGFINRYSLNGEIESVTIVSDDKTLTVKMVSDDKTMIGDVTVMEDAFPNGEFHIYTTSQLKSLLSVLDNSINVSDITGALRFDDKTTKVNYMLAAQLAIPAVPSMKRMPTFDVEVVVDDDFVTKFIKSTQALPDIDSFTFMCKDGKSEIVLGYSSINSNRISLTVTATTATTSVDPISFSAKYLRSIFVANKGAETIKMNISTEGLCHISVEDGDFNSNYYLTMVS